MKPEIISRASFVNTLKHTKMKETIIPFRDQSIRMCQFSYGTFYYTDLNRNAEFTSYKACCSYIRGFLYHSKAVYELFGFSLSTVANVINTFSPNSLR